MAFDSLLPDERKRLVLSVGTHMVRRPFSPVEVGELLQRVVRRGESLGDCATALGLSTSQVSRFIALVGLPDRVKHLVDWGKSGDVLGFTAACELARLPTADDQERAADAVLMHGFSASEVRALVQERRRSGRSIEQCIQSALKMRPTIEIRQLFIGRVTDEAIQKRLATLTQGERDAWLRRALDSVGLTVGGRLGADRFTLVGGEDLAAVLRERRELEKEINLKLGESSE